MGKGKKSVNTPASGSRTVKNMDPKTTEVGGGKKPNVVKMYTPRGEIKGLKGS